MTEDEWLACTEPLTMIRHLRGKVSDRKLRLFACACCRRVDDRLPTDEDRRKAVEVAEDFADGRASKEEMKAVYSALRCVAHANADRAARSSSTEAELSVWVSASLSKRSKREPFFMATDQATRRCIEAELSAQSILLREIIGNPFNPLALEPEWLMPEVIGLAQEIYNERAFERLPMLAKNLEKQGCDDAILLAHCQEPSEHVRGCWVVDALLGKG